MTEYNSFWNITIYVCTYCMNNLISFQTRTDNYLKIGLKILEKNKQGIFYEILNIKGT